MNEKTADDERIQGYRDGLNGCPRNSVVKDYLQGYHVGKCDREKKSSLDSDPFEYLR